MRYRVHPPPGLIDVHHGGVRVPAAGGVLELDPASIPGLLAEGWEIEPEEIVINTVLDAVVVPGRVASEEE